MKRLGVVLLLLAACGGGGTEFDEDALRADLERRYPSASNEAINAAIEAERDACDSDDRVFQFVVAKAVDDGNDESLTNLTVACPDRTRAALDELGG